MVHQQSSDPISLSVIYCNAANHPKMKGLKVTTTAARESPGSSEVLIRARLGASQRGPVTALDSSQCDPGRATFQGCRGMQRNKIKIIKIKIIKDSVSKYIWKEQVCQCFRAWEHI